MDYKYKMKEIRTSKNISQKEIANILKISPITYSHYETQDATIPIKHLIVFCNYFNVSIDYFLGLTNINNNINWNKEINLILCGKRLKNLRKEQNLTQSKLAKNLNTTQSVIADYERGRYIIATPFLYTICKKYNISADYLLGRIDTPKYFK